MNKSLTLLDGFMVGGGIVAAGFMLQLSAGPVNWDALTWPANAIMLAVFIATIIAIYMIGRKYVVLHFLGTYKAAVPAMIYAIILTLIMGLTKQTTDGTWFNNMLSFWPMVLTYVYITVILGVIIINHILHFKWRRDIPFLLNHLGLFIALIAATIGNADMQRLRMITTVGEPEWRALTVNNEIMELPIAIELNKFIMETYDDGSPKRFASNINIYTQNGKNFATTVDVNKPVKVEGYKIYQYGYDTNMGPNSQVSIFELVRDPWLPVVYSFIYFGLASIVMWIAGAWAAWKDKKSIAYGATIAGLLVFFGYIIAMWVSLERPPLRTMGETRLWYSLFLPLAGIIVYGRWRYKWILSFSTLLAVVFIAINIFKPEIHSKTLMPALQSPWFAPHVIVYMMAYALLGASTVMALYLLFFKRTEPTDQEYDITDNLVYAGLAFLTFGMLFGALWAKEAWGHYWSWDPKETWAAITWLAYLVYVHYRLMPNHRKPVALAMLIVAFVLLQVCWWGINYLPSAQATSVHTYSA